VINVVWTALGRASYRLDKIVARLRGAHRRAQEAARTEKTGRVVGTPLRPALEEYPGNVWYLRYAGSVAHSLWRSQEITLFRRYQDRLAEPRLDLGCGDGSFSAALFGHVAFGVDPDDTALQLATDFGIYDHVICSQGVRLPLPDASIGSVFANSVLEHTEVVEPILADLRRVIRPGGHLAFTVPVDGFTRHLTKHFGVSEADFLNHRFDHKQIHPVSWWHARVEEAGFNIEVEHQYQPDWFTFFYRTLTTGTSAFLLRHGLDRNARFRARLVALVRQSLAGTTDGANVFVVARRLL
jgi:SAM-dependent methyltransferase